MGTWYTIYIVVALLLHVERKRFAYMIQGPFPHVYASLTTNSDRDVFRLSFKPSPLTPSSLFYSNQPNTTWTTGRNALLEMAIQVAQARDDGGYEYYIFLDEDTVDALHVNAGGDAYVIMEEWLIARRPLVGYLTNARGWQPRDPSSIETVGCFNVDAVLNAFHYSSLGLMLPYDASLDMQSIFYSQYTLNLITHAFYTTVDGRVGWDCVTIDRTKDRHVANSKSYHRANDWSIPQGHFRSALRGNSLWRFPDRAGIRRKFCRPAEMCRPTDTHGAEPRVVDESWIRSHFTEHPFATNLLNFVKLHSNFLNILRSRAAKEDIQNNTHRAPIKSCAK